MHDVCGLHEQIESMSNDSSQRLGANAIFSLAAYRAAIASHHKIIGTLIRAAVRFLSVSYSESNRRWCYGVMWQRTRPKLESQKREAILVRVGYPETPVLSENSIRPRFAS
jgi:hypothetical protein